jgi:hypothetical protein
MTELDAYLARHYLTEAQIAHAAGIGVNEHAILIAEQLVPAPSYVVSADGKLRSYVFGEMDAGASKAGRYFHTAQVVWIARARAARAGASAQEAALHLKVRFLAGFNGALADLDRSTCRLPDSFSDQGAPIGAGLAARGESAWLHFKMGTFGLCVANPVSEAHIARKEVLQEKLTRDSDNGSRHFYSAHEAAALRGLIAEYAAAAMPFSPLEYPISSRKRLVEDLLGKIELHDEIATVPVPA